MNLDLTTEESMIEAQIKQFVKQELAEDQGKRDHNVTFAEAQFRSLGELGMLGVLVPERYDGAETSVHILTRILEQIAQVDASTALSTALLNAATVPFLLASASEEQKQDWLPMIAMGEYWPILTHFQAKQSSNVKATQKDGTWSLDGTCEFVHMGQVATHYIVIAEDLKKQKKAFWVDASSEKINKSPLPEPLGLRGSAISSLHFDSLSLENKQEIGQTDSLSIALDKTWIRWQVALASIAVGITQAALDSSATYARERKQFGKPLAAFQAIQWKIADIAMELEAARLLVMQASESWQLDHEESLTKRALMASFSARELAKKASQEAIQIYGGYGYTREFPVERFYRDAQALEASWGGCEQLRLSLGQQLL